MNRPYQSLDHAGPKETIISDQSSGSLSLRANLAAILVLPDKLKL